MKKNGLFAAAFTGLILAFSGCEIGLGESLDLSGPELVLLNPSVPRQCVRDAFSISGTVTDDTGVKSVTVTIGDYQWYHESGSWMFKDKDSSTYTVYSDGSWIPNGSTISWEIRNVTIATTGLYELTASSVDTSGNTSSSSQKKLLINIDKTPPTVTVTAPDIHYETWSEINSAFSSYGSTATDYQQLSVVNKIEINGMKISGIASDNNTVKSVTIHLKKVNVSTGEVSADDLVTKKFILNTESNTEGCIVLDSLRTWTATVSADELSSLGSGKSYIQISSECSDTADNSSGGVTVHGYVVYWPAASKPWISLNISQEDTDAGRTKVYAGNSIYGNAFDNSQITKIVQNVWIKNNDGNYTAVDKYSNKILYSYDSNDSSAEKYQTKDFAVTFPNDVADYKIEITATDDSSISSDTLTGYISVTDVTYPTLSFASITNPFGDANGNLKLIVTAADDTSVNTIKFKYAKTADDKKNYADKTSSLWDSSYDKTFDANALTYIDTHTDESGWTKKYWKLEHTVNIFSDLKIKMGSSKLSEQTFIFLVIDNQGNKTVSKFVTPADTVSPVLTFTKINGETYTEGKVLPVFTENFTLGGTWSDDSYSIWGENCPDGIPDLTVAVRGKTVSSSNITLKNDGTWTATVPLDYIKESGSVAGAMDVALTLTDIGGNKTVLQKGFEIDTKELALDYVTASVASGTYASGKEITISLHFNKEAVWSGDGTPSITLNNNKVIGVSSKTSAKVFEFKYTVASGDDVKKLGITDINYDGCTLKDSSENEFTQAKLKAALEANAINKDICILTTVPQFKSFNWDNSTNKLTIVFTGLVTPNKGTIVLTQNEDTLLAPAVLTKDEYNSTSSAVQAYYEEGTNGASSSFVPDLTTKYILKYSYNTNNTELKKAYIATGAHKLTFNILGSSVSPSQDTTANTTTITISGVELPVKGTTYTFNIDAGLVKNEAKTTNTEDTTSAKTISSTGTETPVIRIYKPGQTITGCSGTSYGTVTHALSTTFKIDCETPGAALKYKYDCLVASECAVSMDERKWYGSGTDSRQEEVHVKFVYNETTYSTKLTATNPGGKPAITPVKNDSYSLTETAYTANSEISIGKSGGSDIDYTNGLTYQITASATSNSTTVSAYNGAYRTTLVFKSFTSRAAKGKSASYSWWPWQSDNCTVFLRGGENNEGANSTSGLPASWNINEKDKIVMMKASDSDYYFTTWNITVDKFYFQPMLGLCDAYTDTSSNLGPSKSVYMQEGIMFRIAEYPIGKGEYMTVSFNEEKFDFSVPGKVMSHR